MPEDISEQDLADSFADYFMDKIIKIRAALENTPKYTPEGTAGHQLSKFEPLSQVEAEKIITSLSVKSCELHCISTFLLKKILPSVLPVITRIVNLSIEQNVFVNTWKTAIVRPLLKKAGLDLTLSNYRPVSNLSFLSKVLEKAVLNQFMNYCAAATLLPDYQSAYRRYYSCETALVKLCDDLLWNMENRKVTAIMSVDLSAAFDTVDHDVLLEVLKIRFGITDGALCWFESYLRPRSCKVNVGSCYSTSRNLQFSVPQGSCAGPVLYLTYASTMQDVVPKGVDIHGYADDHIFKTSFNCSEQVNSIKNLEHCASEIKSWMDANRLKMNASKTEFILIGSRQQLAKCTVDKVCVEGTFIDRAESIKYLGVQLDRSLTLKDHIKKKCKIAMWQLRRIRQMRKMLTKEACETLICGLVLSHLDFGNALYIGLPKCDLRLLQRVQNVAAQLVLGNSTCSRSCLKTLHWLPISLRVKHKVLTMVYNSLNGHSPAYIRDLIHLHTPGRSGLRSETVYQRLKVPRTTSTTFAARSFSATAPQWWNEIPDYVKMSDSVNLFKKRLKTYLFDQY